MCFDLLIYMCLFCVLYQHENCLCLSMLDVACSWYGERVLYAWHSRPLSSQSSIPNSSSAFPYGFFILLALPLYFLPSAFYDFLLGFLFSYLLPPLRKFSLHFFWFNSDFVLALRIYQHYYSLLPYFQF